MLGGVVGLMVEMDEVRDGVNFEACVGSMGLDDGMCEASGAKVVEFGLVAAARAGMPPLSQQHHSNTGGDYAPNITRRSSR